jgi:hypothetical protein
MPAPQQILDLIETFERNKDSYLGDRYNETQLRREFLDPFFTALGWDVNNTQGYAEAYKDVIHEDAIKIGSATKAPDYCFRIGGSRKFFLEAKKPSIDIKGDPDPAYQLRRYAWSAKLPLSILSDFQELAVYDCRIRPILGDKSSTARIKYYTYTEYVEKWDEIAAIFSREAVLKGSFDKFADSAKLKKGTTQVDDAFLAEIESWRDDLAHNIALRNPELTGRDLNFAVQITIDRMVFLRICEDRGIERYGELQSLLNGEDIYQRLLILFRKADDRYNSGLFHFNHEKDRPDAPDELTPKLSIDDKILKEIIRRQYYPESPYEFSVLPAEILGQVYEQFLGKVITLTTGHRAKVEDKPEVKKAGGVFYTPSYIVDYIVQNTVGKLIEDKTPKEVEKIKILDPACGSGSFLLGAYQFLLDWHLKWYLDHSPKKWAKGKNPPICSVAGASCSENTKTEAGSFGYFKLTRGCRKKILLNNLFGVDIDSQAVEVTKLSLLLKVLEGEKELNLFAKERALPDLGQNIKCGNSLIGPDFYNGHQLTMFDEEQQYKINAFDWKKEFKEIFTRKNQGFDAVIGNPPYIRIQIMKETQPESIDYFGRTYKSASKGNYDIYVVFIEKASSLLSPIGKLGFIVPNKFLSTDYGVPLRLYLTSSGLLHKIVDFGHYQVFENATIYTCLLFLNTEKHTKVEYVSSIPQTLSSIRRKPLMIPLSSINESPWQFLNKDENALRTKLLDNSLSLLDLPSDISRGSSSGADDIFCVIENKGKFYTQSDQCIEIEKGILRKPLYATDFNRYEFNCMHNEYIIFPYKVLENKYHLFEESQLKKNYPLAYRYLSANKSKLEKRKQYQQWYGYSAPRNLNLHDSASLLIPLLANKGIYTITPKNISDYCMMASAGFSVSIKNDEYSANYVLGLLNSKLLFWHLKNLSNVFRSGWITCTKQYFGLLSIKKILFKNKKEKAFHDKMVSLVEVMLGLHKKLAAVRTPNEKTRIERQITATDHQIDSLVYELYGLTDEEIKLVEDAGKA